MNGSSELPAPTSTAHFICGFVTLPPAESADPGIAGVPRGCGVCSTGVPSVAPTPRAASRFWSTCSSARSVKLRTRSNSDSSPGGMKPVIIVVSRSPSPAMEAE